MVFISKQCTCGNYSPKSTKGVIVMDCKNCGGSPPQLKFIKL